MTQKELAALLGISGPAVSKLVKRGMPTDSLERAKRWRKRHLEPAMVKGSKFDPKAPAFPEIAEAERLALVVLQSLAEACSRLDQERILAPVRAAIRSLSPGDDLRMPAEVWIGLLQYAASDDVLRRVAAAGGVQTSRSIAEALSADPQKARWPPEEALELSADRYQYAAREDSQDLDVELSLADDDGYVL